MYNSYMYMYMYNVCILFGLVVVQHCKKVPLHPSNTQYIDRLILAIWVFVITLYVLYKHEVWFLAAVRIHTLYRVLFVNG